MERNVLHLTANQLKQITGLPGFIKYDKRPKKRNGRRDWGQYRPATSQKEKN